MTLGTLGTIGHMAAMWAVCTGLAYTLHLAVGAVTVGPAEVREQLSAFIAEYGRAWLLIAILTAHLLPRDARLDGDDQGDGVDAVEPEPEGGGRP